MTLVNAASRRQADNVTKAAISTGTPQPEAVRPRSVARQSAKRAEPRIAGGDGTSSNPLALALLASIVIAFLAASAAPTPLYASYAARWHFSPITTTIVFGVYAISVLAALLVCGRASDHIGRKPILFFALALQTIATLVLTMAGGVDALLVGRVLQGLATGSALGALGAAMVEVHPRRGTLTNAASPGLGTGIGALASSVLVQYAPAPTHLIYDVLIGVFVLQAIGVCLLPETVSRKPGLIAALKPELSVPRHLRGRIASAAPILFAVWALTGFFASLGPALIAKLSGSESIVLGACGLLLMTVVLSSTVVALDRVPAETAMQIGIVTLIIAMVITYVGIDQDSTVGLFVGTGVAGFGFGAGFIGGMRSIVPLATPHERAGVVSVIFVVCYLGMGLPSVIAGILVVHGGGLLAASRDYALFVIAFALITFIGHAVRRRNGRRHAEETIGGTR